MQIDSTKTLAMACLGPGTGQRSLEDFLQPVSGAGPDGTAGRGEGQHPHTPSALPHVIIIIELKTLSCIDLGLYADMPIYIEDQGFGRMVLV